MDTIDSSQHLIVASPPLKACGCLGKWQSSTNSTLIFLGAFDDPEDRMEYLADVYELRSRFSLVVVSTNWMNV